MPETSEAVVPPRLGCAYRASDMSALLALSTPTWSGPISTLPLPALRFLTQPKAGPLTYEVAIHHSHA